MTWREVWDAEASPHAVGRTSVYVREVAGGYEAVLNGEIVRGSNPFQIDSRLSERGAPFPRNLYLIRSDQTEAPEWKEG